MVENLTQLTPKGFETLSGFVRYKNTNVAFSSEGKGAAVVLLHGFLENATMWSAIVPEISKRNRVICIDLLGHGQTACLGYVHTMELMAETVEAVLKKLRIRRAIFIGHSLGGYVALALAEKNPQKVKGLCLMNSTARADDAIRVELRNRAIKSAQTNYKNLVRMSISNLFKEVNLKIYEKEVLKIKEQALLTPIQGYIAAQEGMKNRPDRTAVLAQSSFKKLFIIGESDPVLNYQLVEKEAEETATETVVFSDGHMSHIENKHKLIIALKQFVKSC
ncbi:MAG: alpha/beta hydrolase [Polaribacter sp.]|nr:alpha/beta hydrolase [Polaribacter sp.]